MNDSESSRRRIAAIWLFRTMRIMTASQAACSPEAGMILEGLDSLDDDEQLCDVRQAWRTLMERGSRLITNHDLIPWERSTVGGR